MIAAGRYMPAAIIASTARGSRVRSCGVVASTAMTDAHEHALSASDWRHVRGTSHRKRWS